MKLHVLTIFLLTIPHAAVPTPHGLVHVRRNINTYVADSSELKSLKRGIARMKELSKSDPTDPRGWDFQAKLHGEGIKLSETEWNHCQHQNHLFLSWHRMYLYFFERILREQSGDQNLALPYWDSTEDASRNLPLPFREPRTEANPLYVDLRLKPASDGGKLDATAVDITAPMDNLNFDDPNAALWNLGFSSTLEQGMHGNVHSAVGGLMANQETAAEDPIFFLHHANIDRLWGKWLALGQGRNNPSDDGWQKQTYTFYDEKGKRASMAVADILDTAANLSYRYDKEGVAPLDAITKHLPEKQQPEVGRHPITIGSAPAGQFRLEGRVTTIQIPTASNAKALLMDALRAQPNPPSGAAALILENIIVDSAIEGYFEIYLDLPEGVPPDPTLREFLGTVSFFGVVPESRHAEPAKRLTPMNPLRLLFKNLATEGSVFRVTFVRRGMEPPNSQEESHFKGTPTIGAIRIDVR